MGCARKQDVSYHFEVQEKMTTLGEVIGLLSEDNCNRIYVVKTFMHRLGVATLGNIIGSYVSEPEGYLNNSFGDTFKETLAHNLQQIFARSDFIPGREITARGC